MLRASERKEAQSITGRQLRAPGPAWTPRVAGGTASRLWPEASPLHSPPVVPQEREPELQGGKTSTAPEPPVFQAVAAACRMVPNGVRPSQRAVGAAGETAPGLHWDRGKNMASPNRSMLGTRG